MAQDKLKTLLGVFSYDEADEKQVYLSLLQFQKKFREILDYVFCFALLTLQEGMLKRDGNVYTQVVTNCKAKTLIPILREFSQLDQSTIYSDLLKLMMDLLIMELRSIIELSILKVNLQKEKAISMG